MSVKYYVQGKTHDGLGRLAFALSLLGVQFVSMLVGAGLFFASSHFPNMMPLGLIGWMILSAVLAFITLGANVFLTVLRLRNLGYSAWWTAVLYLEPVAVAVAAFFISRLLNTAGVVESLI